MQIFSLLSLSSCAFLALSLPQAQESLTLTPSEEKTPDVCDCRGTRGWDAADYICRDERLGPIELPRKFPLLSFVSDYDRFGGKTPGEFLSQWTSAVTGKYMYPPHDGFCLDQNDRPIFGNMTLRKGTKVDRFGVETGTYISAADAPYDQRALPPQSLNHSPGGAYPFGYHVYTVAKDFVVAGGPIAPWFGQPGLGAQFYVGHTGNILQLIEQGLLTRVPKSDIEPGPGNGTRGCGL